MQYKCRLFSSDVPGDMEAFEELMTQSYDQDGHISITQKETKLTEEGKYLIALHWIEESGASDTAKTIINEVIDEGI